MGQTSPASPIGQTKTWILYNPTFDMARTPQVPSHQPLLQRLHIRFQVALDTMASFLSFVTLVLASMVAASPLELKMESNLGKRDYTVACSDSTQAEFISDA
jgi:hypothetical protein